MLTNPYGPYELGYIFATMCVDNKKQKKAKLEKHIISTDYFLEFENMKEELLVIAYQ